MTVSGVRYVCVVLVVLIYVGVSGRPLIQVNSEL